MISLTFAAAGSPARAELDKLRKSIAELTAAIADVTSAPLPLPEAVERVLHDLRERAAWPVNSLAGYARPGAPLVFDANQTAHSPVDVPLTLPMLYALLPDVIGKGIGAHLKGHCMNGIPLAGRASRLAELEGKLESLLEAEERLTVELLTRGVVIDRSIPESGADIERLLKVWDQIAA